MTEPRDDWGASHMAGTTGAELRVRQDVSDASFAMRDGALSTSTRPMRPPDRTAPSGRPMVLLIAVIGGLAAGFAGAATLRSGAPIVPNLMQVGSEEIDAASRSLLATGASAMADEAKSCRRPLAYVVVRGTSAPGGYVQFRSGAYLSPRLAVGMMSERLALPFPAPYETGRGQITILNASQGIDVFLIPGSHLAATSGTTILPVHWTVRQGGC